MAVGLLWFNRLGVVKIRNTKGVTKFGEEPFGKR